MKDKCCHEESCCHCGCHSHAEADSNEQKIMLIRIITTAVLLIILHFIPLAHIPRLALYLAVYFFIGYDILKKALKGIMKRQVFDENFLMAAATVGAFALAIGTQSGDYTEGIAVMLFYQTGELFQDYAVSKSRKNISQLMDIRPDYANIEIDGRLKQISPEKVCVGSIIIVQPGEKVPLDGIVAEGQSSIDTVALTGESIPRDVTVGDEIISGSINLNGALKIKTTKEFGESTVSKILELVENASSRKSRSESFISRFAKIYTPAVCTAALLLGVVPPVISMAIGQGANWSDWLYRALTFLVVSCPCALVISVPLSFFAGIGAASKEGILIKGSNFLEALSKIKCVVFDKTGTLTQGVFEVTAINSITLSEDKLIEYAALAECASSHPISQSLKKAYGKEIDRSRVSHIEEIIGHGVTAKVDGNTVAVGNGRLMEKLGIRFENPSAVGTTVHIAANREYCGYIIISDVVKNSSKAAVSALKKIGVRKTVMLTGDTETTAQAVALDLGIDEVHSRLLPNDKVYEIERLLEETKPKVTLAFVGDGINDAPVLTRADVGIAMGGIGSDAAIEAADVVLMDDQPLQLEKAIKISKKCIRIVKQNITFTLLVKFACLMLSAMGKTDMGLAIFADVGVMIIAVINAIRVLKP